MLKVAGIEPGMSGLLASVVSVHIRGGQHLPGLFFIFYSNTFEVLSPVKGDAASGFGWDALPITSAFIDIDRCSRLTTGTLLQQTVTTTRKRLT